MNAWLDRIVEIVGNAAPELSHRPREAPPPGGHQPSREQEQPHGPAPPSPPPGRNQEGRARMPPPPPPPPPPVVSHIASSPHDCHIISCAPEDARVVLEHWHAREDRALQQVTPAMSTALLPPSLPTHPSTVGAASPSPRSYAGSHGPTSFAPSFLHAMTEAPTLRSSCSSTPSASRLQAATTKSWPTGYRWPSTMPPTHGS